MNHLYFGDNLDVLKDLHNKHPEGFIDLIYIDPPFNSKRNYNVLFEDIDMIDTKAQKEAFADTWSNISYYDTLEDLKELNLDLFNFINALDNVRISKSAIAYLTTMAIRIHYMHKLLNDTGSFYLHCDPTMSHYLKIICDLIFCESNYINEIIWKRSDAHSDSKQGAKHLGRVHDIILLFAKSNNSKFQTIYNPLPESTINNWYKHIEPETGRRYNKADVTGPGGAAKGNPFYEWNGHLKY
ncbi:MAG: DNA methyltransferase [Bacteroidales bacterium]